MYFKGEHDPLSFKANIENFEKADEEMVKINDQSFE